MQPHSSPPSARPKRGALLSYRLEEFSDDWIIPEEIPVPRVRGGEPESPVQERVHAGDGPAYSVTLDAWLVPDREARRLRIAGRPDGGEPWLTKEEQAVEAAARAEARVRELEAELARRGR